MKQRFLMLLMTVLMMLGMTQVVFAEDIKYYEGSGDFYFSMYNIENNKSGDIFSNDVRLEVGMNYKRLFFSDGAESHELYFEEIDGIEYLTNYNGTDYTYLGEAWHNFGPLIPDSEGHLELGSKISFGNDLGWFYINYGMSLDLVDGDTTHHISTGFTGTAISDRGDYNLYIAGYFTKELTDGIHTLSSADITAQTIAIVAYNKANGVKRVMRENTVEEITVTVSGGYITAADIRGRVQTDGGSLDRYTATIN